MAADRRRRDDESLLLAAEFRQAEDARQLLAVFQKDGGTARSRSKPVAARLVAGELTQSISAQEVRHSSFDPNVPHVVRRRLVEADDARMGVAVAHLQTLGGCELQSHYPAWYLLGKQENEIRVGPLFAGADMSERAVGSYPGAALPGVRVFDRYGNGLFRRFRCGCRRRDGPDVTAGGDVAALHQRAAADKPFCRSLGEDIDQALFDHGR